MSLYDFFTPVSILYDEEPEFFKPQYGSQRNEISEQSSVNETEELRDKIGAETIVGFLNEASTRQYKHAPRYTDLEQTGTEHNPIFTIECSTVGYQGEGAGPNKRVAKIHAAREVLRQIIEKDDHKNFWIPGLTKEERTLFIENLLTKSINMSAAQVTVNDNYVGALQELCLKHKVTPPIYDFEELDVNKEKNFKAMCKVKELTYSAQDRTKKKAKNEAARLMLETLKQTIIEMENELHIEGDDKSDDETPTEIQESREKDSSYEKVNQLLDKLKNSYIVSHEYKKTHAGSSKDSTTILKIRIKKSEQEMGRNFSFSGYGATEDQAKIMAAARAWPILMSYLEEETKDL